MQCKNKTKNTKLFDNHQSYLVILNPKFHKIPDKLKTQKQGIRWWSSG